MPLPYRVWTEDDIQKRNITEPGDYNFQIVDAVLKRTQSGSYDMLEIDFTYWNNQGVQLKQRDWIVFMEEMDWKLRHLCDSVGLLDKYEAKTLEAVDLMLKSGIFSLIVKELTNKNDNTKRKVNAVKDYVKRENQKSAAFVDSDLPF